MGISPLVSAPPNPALGTLARTSWNRLVFGNGSISWLSPFTGATAVPTFAAPQTNDVTFDAVAGNICARGGYGWVRWVSDALTLGGQLFNVAALGPYHQPRCLVFRELLRFTRNTTADPSVFLGHGIACSFDTEQNSGGVVFSGGLVQNFGFLGYGFSPTTNSYSWIKKPRGAVAVTATPLVGFAGGNWHTCDHRLFAPTLAAPARYELRLNDVLITTLHGTDSAFPIVTASNHRYRPCGAASANFGGLTGGIEVARSDIFICDGSPESLLYL